MNVLKIQQNMNIQSNLVKNSIAAYFAAIEIHNKPNISYRYETVSLLMMNAWELALKAYVRKHIKTRSIFTEDGHTISADKALDYVTEHINNIKPKSFTAVRLNIEEIEKYRNGNVHGKHLTKNQIERIREILNEYHSPIQIIAKIENKEGKTAKLVIPSKALNEFSRICSFVPDEKVCLIIDKSKLTLKTINFALSTRLLEGEYPPYEQLIPKTTEKNSVISRDELTSLRLVLRCLENLLDVGIIQHFLQTCIIVCHI